jgi:hypothetical protein
LHISNVRAIALQSLDKIEISTNTIWIQIKPEICKQGSFAGLLPICLLGAWEDQGRNGVMHIRT